MQMKFFFNYPIAGRIDQQILVKERVAEERKNVGRNNK